MLNGRWTKGYYRLGVALKLCGRGRESKSAFDTGEILLLTPSNLKQESEIKFYLSISCSCL
jgi:hypothetical protein